MNTVLFSHDACLGHDPGYGHPECPDRLRAVLRALEDEAFMFLDRRQAPLATRDMLTRVHPERYVDTILSSVPREGFLAIDEDTFMSPGSGEAALRAAGAACAAVDAVMAADNDADGARNAFCATRPPGHHAETGRSMGFCLFNNVAVAARHAQAVHGIRRVAVIDFDVHHGNGTQDIFWDDPAVFFASTHQAPLYPGTGRPQETGAHGNILNATLRAGSGSAEFRAVFAGQILPAVDRFAPELIIVSAGFDAHLRDPLAQLALNEADYGWATEKIGACAARHAAGRLVSCLEGGYNLDALAASAAAHVTALMAL
ncbi:MAG: histone deacetylase family protein [Azospirillaceae bacterium]